MIQPYGGTLIDRLLSDRQLTEVLDNTNRKITVTADDLINLYNIAAGCYSPLDGFMTEAAYRSVIHKSKLPSGIDWTIPVLLRINGPLKREVTALCAPDGSLAGAIEIESIFEIKNKEFSERVFGTADHDHPGVSLAAGRPEICAGGRISLARSKAAALRHLHTPHEFRRRLAGTGKTSFTAFSTRNICHIGHEYLHRIALEIADILGINIITGAEVNGRFMPDVVFDAYERFIARRYPDGMVMLNNLRLPPIYAGPKEAFLQAVVLQNYGFTAFIVGRDHAGINNYYSKYASQEIFEKRTSLDIAIFPLSEPRFCTVCRKVTTERSCRHDGDEVRALNGSDLRRFLAGEKYRELKELLSEDMREVLLTIVKERNGDVFIKETT